jgi:hypothetical protein
MQKIIFPEFAPDPWIGLDLFMGDMSDEDPAWSYR